MIPVLYSKATGRVREFAIDPDRKTEADWQPYLRGKTSDAIGVIFAEDGELPQLQAEVTKATGIKPKDDRYAIVKDDVIVDWIGNADPACGDFDEVLKKYPNAELIPHDKANEKWTIEPGTKRFIEPEPTAEEAANRERKAKVK